MQAREEEGLLTNDPAGLVQDNTETEAEVATTKIC
jgi:hypothetical protein